MKRIALLMALLISAPAAAQTAQSAAPQAPQSPPNQSPASSNQSPAPAATASRTFTAPVGLLFNTVRADKVDDFERVLGYVQAALEKSADAKDRAQWKGWRVFKAAEPGPGGSVLYIFLLDPTVTNADYGLGRLLADAYPDTAQLQEIWKLYTGAITGGGSLLNLSPVKPTVPTEPPSSATPPPTPPADRPLPPDADPNRR
ncbi:MAG TPA: hypothetical protein VL173_12770 [Vicinamibacterales bacterium]|nr:hypothetical protein [Vicinamibacterales bacterium]